MKPIFSKHTRKLAENHAKLGKVFCNPQRVLILWLLADSEKTVSEIADAIGTSRPRTSQHLFIMKSNNILASRRDRKNIYYRIVDNNLLQRYKVLLRGPEG
ncbi:MAG: metalloregulator ArsR/SmtB family transcription factor [Anaerolineales bacterium]